MSFSFRFAAALLALSVAIPAAAGTVTVEVDNVRNAKGHVHVDLCPADRFLKDDCQWAGDAPARPGRVTVAVTGVPAGRYAAQVFHDENDNHKVDRNLLGIPREGIGFSNDAPIRLGPPKFADAAFDTDGGDRSIRLNMRYLLGR